MTYSYIDLSQTLRLYFIFPAVVVYVCYVIHGLLPDRHKSNSNLPALFLKKGSPLILTLTISIIYMLPTLYTFLFFRGLDTLGLGVITVLSNSTVKWITLLLVIFILSFSSIFLRNFLSRVVDSSELVYSLVFIALAWFLVSLSSSVLTFLLVLEVVTLLLFLVIGNVALYHNIGYNGVYKNWLSFSSLEQTQYTLISLLLSFIWVMGFATIFFLWAVAFMFPSYNSIDFMYIGLVSLNWQGEDRISFFNYFLMSGNWLGLALSFKLLLQPFQTFLIIFYRQLPPIVLFYYFQFYYVFVLVFIFFFVVTPFGFITLSWHWVLIGYTSVLLLTLLLGMETLRDISTVLAYSTFVNVSFFLLVGGYHSLS